MVWMLIMGVLFAALVIFSLSVYLFVETETQRKARLAREAVQSEPEIPQKMLEMF
ncbi:hypothetical protein SAMN02745216_02492 [Desulfatibacillum alkenivorans DSM 16219]|uniref:Uncharacterized protein n=1 Tax=Desulfatibacillum alkenivorans DSM 16219 TaxID=1121393 RepID=A0A1M6N2Q3_9BACT|nr:hypothetical protein [Desulfatibacillum alkenivorans]SHJ89990.1 hypothetical protein SAMN02745216_02492 [Desulfatibacillum alkenivorans DSM 16219]